jgi:hypothetical protein
LQESLPLDKFFVNAKYALGFSLMARYVTYAIWDDHETEDNCDSLNPYMNEAFQVFKEYWPVKAADAGACFSLHNQGPSSQAFSD